jgi:acetylornithine deacetylase/succinyl-diaminopimelate desuccinylase-like protein
MSTIREDADGVDFEAFDRIVDERIGTWADELVEYLRIPSEQDQADALEQAAAWTAERLRRVGAEVDVVRADGRTREASIPVPPLVVGQLGDGPRTLNLVQHYDVQPAVPFDLWETPPYEPAMRDGRIWARGATDNKGEFMPRLWAAEALVAAGSPLPCRLRYLVEGQEESGSKNLEDILDTRPDLREADAALIEGGGLTLQGQPEIDAGVRGILILELSVRSIAHDAHSSLASILPNAGVRLVQALATLWNSDGLPAFEGIDAGVRSPTPSQLGIVDAYPVSKLDELRAEFQVEALSGGLDGHEAFRAMAFRPTCNLQGVWSGYTDPGIKTITPAEAHARLDLRLVPEQDPSSVLAALRAHLDARGFRDVRIDAMTSERAWWTDPADPVVQAAIAVSEEVTGKRALVSVSMPATAPMWQVCASRRVPATSLGTSRDDCRAHAPNENVRIDDLVAATRMAGRFYHAFAAIPLTHGEV